MGKIIRTAKVQKIAEERLELTQELYDQYHEQIEAGQFFTHPEKEIKVIYLDHSLFHQGGQPILVTEKEFISRAEEAMPLLEGILKRWQDRYAEATVNTLDLSRLGNAQLQNLNHQVQSQMSQGAPVSQNSTPATTSGSETVEPAA